MMVLPRDVLSGAHISIYKYIYMQHCVSCFIVSTAVQTARRSQGSGTERAAPGSSPPNTHAEMTTTYAPHTSTSDHVVLSSRPLHPPLPLMWETLESPENSPGERRRVDLGSSRRRGLPLIPVASRLLPQPPTVDFNHSLHHPFLRPR